MILYFGYTAFPRERELVSKHLRKSDEIDLTKRLVLPHIEMGAVCLNCVLKPRTYQHGYTYLAVEVISVGKWALRRQGV
jgi:hypothetical protein